MQHCPYSTDCAGCVTYGDTLLDVSHVSLQYGSKLILRDVEVQVKKVSRRCHIQGQVVGFLAPSGTGKTQLFRLMAGLNKPSAGNIFVNSKHEIVKPGMVGVVSQGYTLFEHRTVLGNLELAAKKKYKGSAEILQAITSILKQFELYDKIHSYPAELSGGQRQRIAIAQQLLCSDHFLLMDEPTASLDLVKKEEVAKMIVDISCLDGLNTVIVCSHDIDWLCSVADHLWLMGYERDTLGNKILGAKFLKFYDLVDLGLCWQKDIITRSDFVDFVRQVKEDFRRL